MPSREEHITEILSLHKEMEPFLKQQGLPAICFAYKTKNIQESSDSDLIHCLAWLRVHKLGAYKSLQRAWGLVPPDHWEHYELVEAKGLQEQKILWDARRVCLIAWRGRPKMLRKDYNLKAVLLKNSMNKEPKSVKSWKSKTGKAGKHGKKRPDASPESEPGPQKDDQQPK